MGKRVCAITACTGNYYSIIRSIDHLNIDGFIFGDAQDHRIRAEGKRWHRVQGNYFFHKDPFMRAKYYKCFWHQIPILDNYDVVVWMDATTQIKRLPLEHLNDHDLFVQMHGQRNDVHSEIDVSRGARYANYLMGLDLQKKMPNIHWLAITNFVASNRCEKVYQMNNKWFSDCLNYSPQDQVSFPMACEYAGAKVKLWKQNGHRETQYTIKHPHLLEYKDYYK